MSSTVWSVPAARVHDTYILRFLKDAKCSVPLVEVNVCSYVAERKPTHRSLSSSLRVFMLDYFRKSSTEDGHMSGRPRTEHVHVAAAGALAYARHQDTAAHWIPDGLRASAALPRSWLFLLQSLWVLDFRND